MVDDVTGEEIKKQCAHFGGVPGRCLIAERQWSPGVNPTRCGMCPSTGPVRSIMPTREKLGEMIGDGEQMRWGFRYPNAADVQLLFHDQHGRDRSLSFSTLVFKGPKGPRVKIRATEALAGGEVVTVTAVY